MTVSSGSLLRAMRVPSRSEHSRSHAIQRSRAMCVRVPVHDRGAMLPSPGRLHGAHGGFGHEKRVYLSWTGVVSVIAVLLCAGLDQKILIRRQFFHVTILQDYHYLYDASKGKSTTAYEHHPVPQQGVAMPYMHIEDPAARTWSRTRGLRIM